MIIFENKKNLKFLIIIIAFIFFIFLTSNSPEILSKNVKSGASSINYYLSISENFPEAASVINYHHAQRFIIPYTIGFISKIFSIDSSYFFKILVISELLLIFFIKSKLIKIFKLDFFTSVIFYSIFIFNPYILRYFIIYPEMIVDLTFILSGYLFIFSIISNNLKFFLIAFILAFISRQTGIAFYLSFIICVLFLKNNLLINKRNLVIISFFFIIIYFLNIWYLNKVGLNQFPFNAVLGLFKFLLFDFNFYDLLIFLLFPFLGLFPFAILIFNKKFEINKIFDNSESLFLFFSLLIIIAQPYLGGPFWTGKNIIRLVILGYPIIFYLIFFSSKQYKEYSKSFKVISLILLFVWSLHPSYSKIKIFKIFNVQPLIKPLIE